MQESGELNALSKEHYCPLSKRFEGLQSPFRRFGEDKDLFPLRGCAPRRVQPFVFPLYRLRYPGSCTADNSSAGRSRSIEVEGSVLLRHGVSSLGSRILASCRIVQEDLLGHVSKRGNPSPKYAALYPPTVHTTSDFSTARSG